MLSWTIAAGAALVAVVALAAVRRLQRKVDRLSQSYWELRYEYTRLRSEVRRLDPAHGEADFVPLSSLKK